jgi:serine/threonine protein kinase
MRKFFQTVIVLSLITVAGAALYVYLTDKHVIVFKNGTIQAVDDQDVIFLNDGTILYDDEIVEQDEIKYYAKRSIKHLFLDISNRATLKWNRFESELDRFLATNNVPESLKIIIPLALMGLLLFGLVWLKFGRAAKGNTPKNAGPENKVAVSEIKEGIPNQLDIVGFFLNLFKCQIGADPDAQADFVPLMSNSSGTNHIYELRVKHMEDWAKRRMTIGPLGEEAGSKSKCYYVIYDVHMVVKVPARPVTDFEFYIESIKKEVAIVNKLIPKECIVPKVSVILSQIHTFPYSEDIPTERLEDKYINWVRRSTEYQDYLKINSTFVYFMDLSQYYFLGHILDELHDIKDLIAREIFENADIIFEPAKFKGRYGVENDAIFEVRQVYNRVEADIRRLVAQTGINSNIPLYQFQSWFYKALAQKEATEDSDRYPQSFVSQLNILLKKAMQENSEVIDIYRKTIKNYVYMSSFEQNSHQMSAITVNLLDILAWFRQKRVSMRDLKPDNLFVAGDPARYPLFLRSAQEFSLGIIDVETAVDFEKSKYTKTKQPLLGGTPFYATPSHFIRNDVLSIKFDNLGKILHLQDWHATLVMIYKVVTGELLFEQTAKLFGDLRSMLINANKPENFESDIFEETSRMFWHSAVVEFQIKMDEKEQSLKAIQVLLPETVKYMFGKVLAKERQSLAQAIKACVESQNIFEKQQIREQLMNSSYAKTCQFKADLEEKARRSQNSNGLRMEAISFLNRLADLKALFGQHIYMVKLLSNPRAEVSVYDILTFMFNVVLNNMYRPQWGPLLGASVTTCDKPDEKSAVEATI